MIAASTYLSTAQWVLLFGFGGLLFVVYRQLAWAFARLKPDREFGPHIGSPAAAFEYTRVSDRTIQYFQPNAGHATFLAFVDPTCGSCEALVASLGTLHREGELDGVRVLLVTSEPESYLQISDEFQETELEIARITASDALEAYRASVTPLLVGIDERGTVRAAGVAIQPDEIREVRARILAPAGRTLTKESTASTNGAVHKAPLTVGANNKGGEVGS